MRSSKDLRSEAARIVTRILALRDEVRMAERIDVPVDLAMGSFRFVWPGPFSPRRFHRVLGQFQRHVDRHMAARHDIPLLDRAGDEAVHHLETAYQGEHEPGYDGAVWDAVHPDDGSTEGIDAVLVRFAQFYKGVLRQRYVDWVYARHLPMLDHELRRAIADHVLEQFGDCLPAELRSCAAWEWEPYLQDLLETAHEVDSVCERLIGRRDLHSAARIPR